MNICPDCQLYFTDNATHCECGEPLMSKEEWEHWMSQIVREEIREDDRIWVDQGLM